MKNTAHSARQFVFCCVSTLLTALLAVLTFLRPERLPLAPLLVAMLLRPTLLLVTAGVNFSCLKMGVRALFSGKPDRHTAAVLTVLLALVLCTLGVCPDAPVTAALLLTASAWLDLLEQRLESELPGAQAERTAEIAKLEQEMKEASKLLEFEYAAVLRDRIIELRGGK